MTELPSDLHLGLPELDRQHQQFLELLNRLREATEKNYGFAASQILGELAVQTRIHFAVEETLMRMFGYAETENHADQHQHLAAQLEKFQKHAQDMNLSADVTEFIERWLSNHVQTYDKALGNFLSERGVQPR